MRKLKLVGIIFALGLLGAACSAGEEAAGPTPRPTGSAAPEVPALVWSELAPPAPLGEGWTVGHCPGGGQAPIACVYKDGAAVGSLEHIESPAESFTIPGFQEALAAGNPKEALRVLVADYHTALAKDRAEGCGRGYAFEPHGPQDAAVMGRAGLSYGFTGKRDGRAEERHLQFVTIIGDKVHLVGVPAYDPTSCAVNQELTEFDTQTLASFEKYAAPLVAASRP